MNYLLQKRKISQKPQPNRKSNVPAGDYGDYVSVIAVLSLACILLLGMYSFKTAIWKLNRTDGISDRRYLLDPNHQNYRRTLVKGRILYIVTSIHEFDTGGRSTIQGSDRFAKTIIPLLSEAVQSLIASGYAVDVYLITQYTMSAARTAQLLQALPVTVGVQVWDDATPLGYVLEDTADRIQLHTRGLSRQHRYVLKDKLPYYDLFLCFEDDMLLHGAHVDQYWDMTNELFQLRQTAPRELATSRTVDEALNHFYGSMTVPQLARTIPGWIRVEVARPDFKPSRMNPRFPQIPMDYEWPSEPARVGGADEPIDASVCCHIDASTAAAHNVSATPTSKEIFFWEMRITALGVRNMPSANNASSSLLSWVMLLGGNNQEIFTDPNFIIGDYWSGRDGYFNAERPDRKLGDYSSNQGGWMATRRQIVEWHGEWCRGGFLPPYDLPFYRWDGLDGRSVEYWSGGIQLAGVNGCNLQRIVSLDPYHFSRQLLYHTSNNKQLTRRIRRRFSGHTLHEFWGQINTVRKNAEAAMKKKQMS